jgi:hypothetical protein
MLSFLLSPVDDVAFVAVFEGKYVGAVEKVQVNRRRREFLSAR